MLRILSRKFRRVGYGLNKCSLSLPIVAVYLETRFYVISPAFLQRPIPTSKRKNCLKILERQPLIGPMM